MKITNTLSRYLAKTYFLNTLFLLVALLAVIYLFDTVELIRRASKHPDLPLSLVLKMGFLKLPEVGQIITPFAILFGAMFTFWQLTRRHELVVVRAAGFSVWQFLMPIVFVALFIGLLQMTVVNPIGALLVGKFERLESTYLSARDSQIAIFEEGLWLRQGIDDGQGYIIFHAQKISQPEWVLKNVTVMFFAEEDNFFRRMDARQAVLQEGHWLFKGVIIHEPGLEKDHREEYSLPTTLTTHDIEESFSSPESMSFWRLPRHIRTLEQTGFDASRLRVHYHNLLSQPLLFAAMILLAATVSLRPPRLTGTATLFAVGIFIGFFVFFMSSFLQALGASQQIPVVLAAWSPALICFLLGISVLMNLEDG